MKNTEFQVFGTLFVIAQFLFALPYMIVIYVIRAVWLVFMKFGALLREVYRETPDTKFVFTNVNMFRPDDFF